MPVRIVGVFEPLEPTNDEWADGALLIPRVIIEKDYESVAVHATALMATDQLASVAGRFGSAFELCLALHPRLGPQVGSGRGDHRGRAWQAPRQVPVPWLDRGFGCAQPLDRPADHPRALHRRAEHRPGGHHPRAHRAGGGGRRCARDDRRDHRPAAAVGGARDPCPGRHRSAGHPDATHPCARHRGAGDDPPRGDR